MSAARLARDGDPVHLEATGEILLWPGGYAMSIGRTYWGGRVVRCCDGHDAPEDAKSHGMTRLLEVALVAADRDVAAWKEKAAS